MQPKRRRWTIPFDDLVMGLLVFNLTLLVLLFTGYTLWKVWMWATKVAL